MLEAISECPIYNNMEEMIERCDSLCKVTILVSVIRYIHTYLIHVIIDHILVQAQVEISYLEQGKLKEIEIIRENLVELTNEAAHAIMNLNNDLSKLAVSTGKVFFLLFESTMK